MTDQQPEALLMAQILDSFETKWGNDTAALLRRQHDLLGKANALCRIRAERIRELADINARLLEALAEMVEMIDCGDEHGAGSPWHTKARAAIAAARASDETSR